MTDAEIASIRKSPWMTIGRENECFTKTQVVIWREIQPRRAHSEPASRRTKSIARPALPKYAKDRALRYCITELDPCAYCQRSGLGVVFCRLERLHRGFRSSATGHPGNIILFD